MVLLLAAVIGATVAEHAFSSQHIHKHDGHHEPVHHGHGHEHHDYYVRSFLLLIFIIKLIPNILNYFFSVKKQQKIIQGISFILHWILQNIATYV